MGGAFIGVADDATAASWNPAGLIQLEKPEVSIVLSHNHRREETSYEIATISSSLHKVSTEEINYFSWAYPFSLFQKNMIVSLNYQHLYDYTRNVTYPITTTEERFGGLMVIEEDLRADYDREGALKTISPAFAVQILPMLSLGFTLNIWDKNICGWESRYRAKGVRTVTTLGVKNPPTNVEHNIKEKFNFKGFNFNTGFLWNISGIFSLGGVFKAPFRADLERDYSFDSTDSTNPKNTSDTQKLDMPMSYGLGVAARLSDVLTFDLDIYRTQWNDHVRYTSSGSELNPVTGDPTSASESKPTTQVRLGGEYLIIKQSKNIVIPLRAGVFYDPEPSENNPDDFYGLTLGSGIAYKSFVFDMAYQYRFGRDVKTSSFTVANDVPVQDVDQHTWYMSLIYHF